MSERMSSRLKEPHGTLGELVVTDPLDPFVWLANNYPVALSEKAKQMMWSIYRLSGHLPGENQAGKLRDAMPADTLFAGLNEVDTAHIEGYGKYLREATVLETARRLDEEKSVVPVAQPEHEGMLDTGGLCEPRALILEAIMEHIRIINEAERSTESEQ